MVAFDVRGVSYSYTGRTALEALSLQIVDGESIALVGANGSGKSTLLRILAGLTFAGAGSVSFFGKTLTAVSLEDEEFFYSFRRRVGVVFQNADVQLFNASVFDEIAFGPLQLGWPKQQIRAKVEETLVMMGIADLRNRAPHRLSGGEKKRVAIASVLVLNPEVLLLDEPMAALDPRSQTQILELLAAWRNSSRTVITATHDLDSLEDISDRCYLLQDGRIAAQGDPLTILHDVNLLERTGLVRPHSHAHAHVHAADISGLDHLK